MITYKTAVTDYELEDILKLQKANLASSITSEEKEKEGFVTVIHDFQILKAMNDVCPHIVAKEAEKVIGYALCMHPKFGDQIEVLKPMFAEIYKVIDDGPSIAGQNKSFGLAIRVTDLMVMGQICIDKAYRKQGVFRGLYDFMKHSILPDFSCIVTEVDASNTRSINAHYAVGFKTLSTYPSDGKTWEVIYLD